jgi:hypothetical protein
MKSGLEWSRQIASNLTEAQTSAWFAFRAVADSTHGPGDALVVRQFGRASEPYYTTKRFDVFRHYSNAGPPGSTRLETRVGDDQLSAVAFRASAVSLVVTSSSHDPRAVDVDLGPGAGRVEVRGRLRARALPPPPIEYRGQPLSVTLLSQSVTTFTLRSPK